jgi:hypothetical protein
MRPKNDGEIWHYFCKIHIKLSHFPYATISPRGNCLMPKPAVVDLFVPSGYPFPFPTLIEVNFVDDFGEFDENLEVGKCHSTDWPKKELWWPEDDGMGWVGIMGNGHGKIEEKVEK